MRVSHVYIEIWQYTNTYMGIKDNKFVSIRSTDQLICICFFEVLMHILHPTGNLIYIKLAPKNIRRFPTI